jgi:integrase
VDRGEVKVSREDFATFWTRLLADRRAYMTSGSHLDLVTHGRKRLLPIFGADALAKIDEDRVREWLASMIELIEADELAPKTVNNARTCRSVAFNEAVRRGFMPRNPCAHVPALPLEQAEIEYLRLAEIQPYIDTCAGYYTALAAFLIATGARVSEAVATRWPDLDLDQGVIRVYRQRARTSDATRVTKGKRFRAVQIGPRLSDTLRTVRDQRAADRLNDGGWVSSARRRVAGATRVAPSRCRRTARPSTSGTRLHSRTPASATCPCTRSVTPRPPRGSPWAIR